MLRPYQQDAVNAAIAHMRKSVEPCLIDAATGAGKSYIIAAIAEWLKQKSNKKIIVLQPNSKLLKQNIAKYRLTGNPASIYSATGGAKCLKHDVIFATPLSLKKVIEKIEVGAIIVDEAHGVTPTFLEIYEKLKEKNTKLRVVGLTATPYRLGQGYIYQINEKGEPVEQARNPFFHKCVYRIPAWDLIKQGYLTPPAIGVSEADGYKTIIIANDQKELDKAVIGQGRKTSKIIEDVVHQCQNRQGVMIFAANTWHANEIAASLPSELTGVVYGGQSNENDKILEAFEQRRLKYIVNVNMLTTGYDASHIDCIVLMRATESVALLQQMIGRSLRLEEGKLDALILDYAENIERHAPDGDIFNPEIKTGKEKSSKYIIAVCPTCSYENTFSINIDAVQGMEIDENGYVIDLNKERINTEWGHQPAHYGRRCNGTILETGDRCGYYWTYKECDECNHKNDITARRCTNCRTELIDPNEKLKQEAIKRRNDPTIPKCERVKSWQVKKTLSKAGNEMYDVTFITEFNTIRCFFVLTKYSSGYLPATSRFLNYTDNGQKKPETIRYYKSNNFWNVIDYNGEPDEVP